MAGPRARELWEMPEIVNEILIRVPPHEPGCLVRASLACKLWCHILSGPAFRSSYRALHRTPPILGFLQSWEDVKRFVPTTSFRLRNPHRQDTFVLDCRHGRLLVAKYQHQYAGHDDAEEDHLKMVVWDPVSGSRTELPHRVMFDPDVQRKDYLAVVLCAAAGCSHDACNLGPFFVAFICLNQDDDDDAYVDDQARRLVSASLYSSETRRWSSPTHIGVGGRGAYIPRRPGVIVGQALYVLLHQDAVCAYIVLRYDLVTRRLSDIDLPGRSYHQPLLISGEGGLRVVQRDQHNVCRVWSMEMNPDGELGPWIQLRQVDLKMLLPVHSPSRRLDLPDLVGRVEGTDIIIATTDSGVFTVDLNSLKSRKLSSKKHTSHVKYFDALLLYTSFSNPPAVAGVVDEPGASEAGK